MPVGGARDWSALGNMMTKGEPGLGFTVCKRCKGDVWDLCEKCVRWGCYKCDFKPEGHKGPGPVYRVREQQILLEANSVAGKKKTKMGPVKITKLEKPKAKPAPKPPRAPKAKAPPLPRQEKGVRPQTELFPLRSSQAEVPKGRGSPCRPGPGGTRRARGALPDEGVDLSARGRLHGPLRRGLPGSPPHPDRTG